MADYRGLVAVLQTRYGIGVSTKRIPSPFVGDLNGREISLDVNLTVDQRFFTVAHLFGHTVQWNLNPDEIEQWLPLQPPVKRSALAGILQYERKACRYSASLLCENGWVRLRQWFSNYAAADVAYLMHYYKTGELLPVQSFWRDTQPLIAPLRIPPFVATRRLWRSNGVVI